MMPLGPGKYDDMCTLVREQTEAQGVIVIVINGNKGTGFSCQADILTVSQLPEMLELVASQMRQPEPAPAAIKRLIEEVKADKEQPYGGYNRTYNRHNR